MKKEKKTAFDCALHYLSFRNRSETEILKHLKKNEYNNDEIEKTLKRLKELNYVNDEQFVENYIESHFYNSVKSRREIMFKLIPFEIDKDIINEAFDSIDKEVEISNAVRFLEKQIRTKKYNFNCSEELEKLKQKAASHGFGYNTISKALDTLKCTE